MAEEPKRSIANRWMTAAQLVVVALVAWGIFRSIQAAQEDLIEQNFQVTSIRWSWLAVAGLFYTLGASTMGWYWYHLLRRLDQQPNLFATVRAYFIGHLGKYVPGKVMVVFLRTVLIRSSQVDTTIAATSVFVDTLTMMAAGAFLSGLILVVLFRDQTMLQLVAFGMMILTAAFTAPPILKMIIRKLKSQESAERMAAVLDRISWGTLAIGWVCGVLCWLFYGLSLWAVIRALPMADDVRVTGRIFVELVATVSLATVSGFVSLIPGGVGVREWVLNQLMAPTFGHAVAIVAAVLLRLSWLLTEIVVSTILYWVRPGADNSDKVVRTRRFRRE